MNEVTKEWVAKADGDFRTARRDLATVEAPNFDAALLALLPDNAC